MRTPSIELPPSLSSTFVRQGSVFSTAQAVAAGVHNREITTRVARGEWVRLRRGAYTTREVHDAGDDAARHVLAARAAHLTLQARHAFSHTTAAVLHGLPLHQLDLGEVHVTHVDGEGTGRHESGVWHHVGAVPVDDLTRAGDLPCLALPRTVFDVARVASAGSALVVADAALRRGTTASDLRRQLEAGMDWPGARAASRVLPLADGRAESVGESLARLVFHDLGLDPDELQVHVRTDAGEFRVDFAWTRWRIAGEFDGRVKYGRLVRPGETPSDAVWRERQRELAIERAGWIVVRFTWAELHDLELVRHRLLEAIARAQRLFGLV
ncbi:MAG: type IV toxin-antitoxin system AbiEi family antitoxin domain-containing protein [Angustibacter sp.]